MSFLKLIVKLMKYKGAYIEFMRLSDNTYQIQTAERNGDVPTSRVFDTVNEASAFIVAIIIRNLITIQELINGELRALDVTH